MKYYCPECKSDRILVEEVTSYWIHNLEFFCHSVMSYDEYAVVRCLDCGCTGVREDFKVKE